MFREKRKDAQLEGARFSTQRCVTYILLLIFATAFGLVMTTGTEAERSAMLQTVINLTVGAIGFWIGSSKEAADKLKPTVPAEGDAMPWIPKVMRCPTCHKPAVLRGDKWVCINPECAEFSGEAR